MEKSTIQLAIEKATNILKFFTEKASTEVIENFKSVKLVDSDQLVEYSELVVDADVSISTSNGSVPTPDAEYSTIDGAVFTTKSGKIESISKEADEAVAEDSPAEEVKTELAVEAEVVEDAPVAEATVEVKALEEKVAKLEEAVKAILEAVALQPSEETVKEFNSKVEKLSKVPTQTSIDNRVEIKESELEKYSRIANSFKV